MKVIKHLETYYACKCECGQSFFVRVQGPTTKLVPEASKVATRCPGCQDIGWLTRFRNKIVKKRKDPVRLYPTQLLFDELPLLEESLEYYRSRFRLCTHHLTSLQRLVAQTIKSWNEDWNRAVMPCQFEELIRCLRDQQDPRLQAPKCHK